jgi:DNA-binding NtrC family response regulator
VFGQYLRYFKQIWKLEGIPPSSRPLVDSNALTLSAYGLYIGCMKRTTKLTPVDRDFFGLVAQAAFSNPFGSDRAELDFKIAGCPREVADDVRVECVTHKVMERVRSLEEEGRADVRLYAGEDRYLMQSAFLFEVFHRFLDALDRLILDQIQAGDTPCRVAFAREVLSMLARRGFTSSDAHRFLAMFYQVRRAFYFIDRDLIGESPSMKQLRLHLWNNVFTHDIRWYERYLWNRMEDFSTLLLGETGTGKGTAAAAIGRSGFIPYDGDKERFGESFTRNFISINLSQYPEALIESELFGHRKGAFTGAIEQHHGVFARCSPHGSIFLDEIGDVTIPVQIKLLQVLQERTFSPVGSHDKQRFNGRVIAATNQPLDELRRKGLFRDDFYYRLCSDIIVVPSLRQRLRENPRELDAMLKHVILRLTGEASKELLELVREVLGMDLGLHYGWPGNVRELEQAVRRILLTRHYQGDHSVAASDLQARIAAGIAAASLNARELMTAYCALLHQRYGTYEEVSRRTGLDRRTVKKYIESAQPRER